MYPLPPRSNFLVAVTPRRARSHPQLQPLLLVHPPLPRLLPVFTCPPPPRSNLLAAARSRQMRLHPLLRPLLPAHPLPLRLLLVLPCPLPSRINFLVAAVRSSQARFHPLLRPLLPVQPLPPRLLPVLTCPLPSRINFLVTAVRTSQARFHPLLQLLLPIHPLSNTAPVSHVRRNQKWSPTLPILLLTTTIILITPTTTHPLVRRSRVVWYQRRATPRVHMSKRTQERRLETVGSASVATRCLLAGLPAALVYAATHSISTDAKLFLFNICIPSSPLFTQLMRR